MNLFIRAAQTESGVALAESRKFAGLWRVEKIDGGFVVKVANGFRMTDVYARDEKIMDRLPLAY